MLLDECERGFGHFTPAMINGKRVAPIQNLLDLGYGGILLLLLERGIGNRPRYRVVFLAGNDEQRPTLRILNINLGFCPRVQIGRSRLEDRPTGAGYRVSLIQSMRFFLVYGIGEGETELIVGQRDGAGVVEWIAPKTSGSCLAASTDCGSSGQPGAIVV